MFQPFQNLYRHINATDPKLYEALERISFYLKEAVNMVPVTIVPGKIDGSVVTILQFNALDTFAWDNSGTTFFVKVGNNWRRSTLDPL